MHSYILSYGYPATNTVFVTLDPPLSIYLELASWLATALPIPQRSARAELSGVMVIDTITTTPGKPKTLYITGAFYTTVDPIMGVFKYFNKYDYNIEPGGLSTQQ